MKKISLILMLVLTVGMIFALCACGENPGGGDTTWVETVDDEFLCEAADCNTAATYYKSSPDGKQINYDETFTVGNPLGHNFAHACSEKCSRCGAKNADKVAHTFAYNCSETCSVCGAKHTTGKTDHTYDEGCDADGKCNVCGAVSTTSLHSFEHDCDEYCICGDKVNPNYKPYSDNNVPGVCDWCGRVHAEHATVDTKIKHKTEDHMFAD